jgi:GGDEF domain-containing protein
VLAAVASALRGGVRGSDLVGRYGGDEFVIVLPETTSSVALLLAQRLRTEIRHATLATVGEPIAASVGVAEWASGSAPEELLGRADRALRIAKKSGGGPIADPGGPAPSRRPRRRARYEGRARADGRGRLLGPVRKLIATTSRSGGGE